jgi:hypothetical protein
VSCTETIRAYVDPALARVDEAVKQLDQWSAEYMGTFREWNDRDTAAWRAGLPPMRWNMVTRLQSMIELVIVLHDGARRTIADQRAATAQLLRGLELKGPFPWPGATTADPRARELNQAVRDISTVLELPASLHAQTKGVVDLIELIEAERREYAGALPVEKPVLDTGRTLARAMAEGRVPESLPLDPAAHERPTNYAGWNL